MKGVSNVGYTAGSSRIVMILGQGGWYNSNTKLKLHAIRLMEKKRQK